MKPIEWIKKYIITLPVLFFAISTTNFIINPYDIYKINIFNFPKNTIENKAREIKSIKVRQAEYASVAIGTSRILRGIDVSHMYFKQPSYNLAVNGSSMYESKELLEIAIKTKKLKYVLLGLDYIMFSKKNGESINIDNTNLKYLFSIDVLIDSLKTILQVGDNIMLENGVMLSRNSKNYKNNFIAVEKDIYETSSKNSTYTDTGKSSLLDFEELLEMAYENNIDMDIIFNPSHIRLWESLDYFIGLDNWYKWKKDIVLIVEKVAKKYNKKPFRVVDFAVYHEITNEKIPTDDTKMKYYLESSHYTPELGNIVLDRLMDKSDYKDFGVEITSKNIDAHIEKQKSLRAKFIDTREYRREVFGE